MYYKAILSVVNYMNKHMVLIYERHSTNRLQSYILLIGLCIIYSAMLTVSHWVAQHRVVEGLPQTSPYIRMVLTNYFLKRNKKRTYFPRTLY